MAFGGIIDAFINSDETGIIVMLGGLLLIQMQITNNAYATIDKYKNQASGTQSNENDHQLE